jgi:antitoxin component of MazEF toxin-antitoxin module
MSFQPARKLTLAFADFRFRLVMCRIAAQEIAMPQLTIVSHGDAAAVVLPVSVLESIGLQVGDVLEATVGERELILRPAEDAARGQARDEITREVFARRRDA